MWNYPSPIGAILVDDHNLPPIIILTIAAMALVWVEEGSAPLMKKGFSLTEREGLVAGEMIGTSTLPYVNHKISLCRHLRPKDSLNADIL